MSVIPIVGGEGVGGEPSRASPAGGGRETAGVTTGASVWPHLYQHPTRVSKAQKSHRSLTRPMLPSTGYAQARCQVPAMLSWVRTRAFHLGDE